jgi:signal transduction histidine kinase
VNTERNTHEIGEALAQLALINRVTIALSEAVGADDLTQAIAAALTSALGLHFSRAFLLAYDDKRECFSAKRAVGVSDADQARRLVKQLEAEQTYLDGLAHSFAAQDETCLAELMDHLQLESLWIETIQHPNDEELAIEGWKGLFVTLAHEQPESLYARLVKQPCVLRFESASDIAALPPPLQTVLTTPFVVLSVHTSKGARLAILADRAWQPDPAVNRGDLLLLEWFQSQAGLAWSRAELNADLACALDHLRELDTLKNNFLATISHELRTPLTAILGFLDLVLGHPVETLTDRQRGLLDRSRHQAGHLLGLVNDLLELAEHQAEGARPLPVGRVDAHEALETAMSHLAESPRWGRACVTTPPMGSAPCLVAANELALERIFFHLLDNALKFSPPGSEVAVRFERFGDNWHLAIADRGIGMERAQLRGIFSLFYQIDSRLSRSYPGMGIGLTLVKVLLEATGGNILVESEPGQGSVFTVVYPRWENRGLDE